MVAIAGGLGLEALETATGRLLLLNIEVANVALPAELSGRAGLPNLMVVVCLQRESDSTLHKIARTELEMQTSSTRFVRPVLVSHDLRDKLQFAIVHVTNGANVLKDWVEIWRTPLFSVSELGSRPDGCLSFALGKGAELRVVATPSSSQINGVLNVRIRLAKLQTPPWVKPGRHMLHCRFSCCKLARCTSCILPGQDKLIVQLVRLHQLCRCVRVTAQCIAPAVVARCVAGTMAGASCPYVARACMMTWSLLRGTSKCRYAI